MTRVLLLMPEPRGRPKDVTHNREFLVFVTRGRGALWGSDFSEHAYCDNNKRQRGVKSQKAGSIGATRELTKSTNNTCLSMD